MPTERTLNTNFKVMYYVGRVILMKLRSWETPEEVEKEANVFAVKKDLRTAQEYADKVRKMLK